ncbi:MAG: recombination protein RecR [Bacilli bacterium]|nr:recombination protein RecR [Bacilli bacterium]
MDKLKALIRLEESLAKLPSIGRKSAERMAYALLDMSDEDLMEFSNAIRELKSSIHRCPVCGNLTDHDFCEICSDEYRDKETLIVVSYPKDVIAIENSGGYRGLYHVLHGVIAPNKGIGLEELNYRSLIARIEEGTIKEIIFATNPTVEGETTALYLAKKLEPYHLTMTRLAYGLQMGGNLDYTDSITLGRALEGRRKI